MIVKARGRQGNRGDQGRCNGVLDEGGDQEGKQSAHIIQAVSQTQNHLGTLVDLGFEERENQGDS